MLIGAADMGTGCDTILAQMAAECLDCPMERIEVLGADTDASPYDSGSYASSTTYITGKAVEKACQKLIARILEIASGMLEAPVEELVFASDHVEILDYKAVVDCGTVVNPNLARVQAEGGIVQGIGMTLYENIQYNEKGRMLNNSFMQYKVPSRRDMGNLQVEFESSYEPTGPFGAKSIRDRN